MKMCELVNAIWNLMKEEPLGAFAASGGRGAVDLRLQ